MARNNLRHVLYNCILSLSLLVMLGISMLGGGSLTAVALEQEARCGTPEHSHSQDCYLGGVLLCSEKAHLHTEDCYLVLLQDNDINWLLQTMDGMEEKSLEGVINSALVQALNLNPTLSGEERQTVYLASENISDLNRIIAENEIQPAVVLNENLSDEHVLMYTPPVVEEAEEEQIFDWWPVEPTTPVINWTEPEVTEPSVWIPQYQEPTDPSETTQATEETESTEETTESTEETTEPTESTTEPTEETTEPTEGTTEPTEETTEPTEGTTEPTEESTEPTEESTEDTETDETQKPIGPVPQYGQIGIYLLVDGQWTCLEVMDMTAQEEFWGVNYSIDCQLIRERLDSLAVVSERSLQAHLVQTTAAPPEGLETASGVRFKKIHIGIDGTARHFLLADASEVYQEETQQKKQVYIPIEHHAVTLVREDAEEIFYVQSGESLDEVISPEDTWETEDGTPVSADLIVTAPMTLYAAVSEDEAATRPEPEETTEPTEATEPVETTAPTEATEPAETTAPTEATEPAETTAPTEATEPVETTAPTEATEPVETTAPTEATEPAETTAPTEATEPAETTAPIEATEPVETTAPTETTEPAETTAPTEATEPSETTAPTEVTEPTETTESTEATEPSETMESTEETGERIAMFATGTNASTFALQDGGASTYAVGGNASTGTRAINFYITLDGKVTFVNSSTLTNNNSSSNQSRKKYCSVATAVNAYNNASGLITGLHTGNLGNSRTYDFRYNVGSASNFTNTPTYATYSNTPNVYFNNTSTAQYAILTKGGATLNFYTITLDRSAVGGGTEVFYVEENLTPDLGMEFDQYSWYRGETRVTQAEAITGKTTYVAQKKNIEASFEAPDNTQLKPIQISQDGDEVMTVLLPSLADTQYSGWLWVEKDSDSSGYESDGSATVTITDNTVFTVVPKWYTITFQQGEDITTETIRYRENFTFPTLPEGYTWRNQAGEVYTGGTVFLSVTEDLSFYAADRVITLYYHVNFNDSNVTQFPALVDSGDQYYGEESVPGGQSTIAKSVTPRIPARSTNSTNECVVYLFQGWKITGTDIIIEPGARLTWQELAAWAGDSDYIDLTGQWMEGGNLRSANFYIRYDSVAVDVGGNLTGGSTDLYTPSLHSTFVGGLDGYENSTRNQLNTAFAQTDTTADNSYSVDQRIRSLYGIRSEGIWLYDFPTDEAVFEYLRNDKNVSNLRIGGEVVPIDQLSTEYYAVRWYVFKKEDSSWHADGKLVPREGHITISKRFNGDPTAVAAAKRDFYILASTDGRTERLTLPNTTDNYFEWKITGVHLGEQWTIREYTSASQGYSYYAESLVYDTDGEMQPISRNGTQVSVAGKAYAIDVDPNQGMMVDFTNYYYNKDSILIKKEDAQTGRPIGGAAFQLFQNGSMITFDYDQSTGTYNRNTDGTGTHTQIVTKSDGFSIISTTGFSYNMGDVTVREVVAPAGYDPAPDITLGDNGSGTIVLKNVDGVAEDLWSGFAEVPNNDTLIVKDRVSEQISVTVEKHWDASQPASSVDVVLQANGQNAAAVFPGFTNAQVRLTRDNNWTYTWTQLPRVADGTAVTWSVKEVAVGSESALADGSFPSWTAIHSPGRGTDADGDGDVDAWNFTITNTQRRTQLIVIKTDSQNTALKGAEFTLQQVQLVNGSWQPVSGSITVSQTSNSNGQLNFDSLVTNANYLLTETKPPPGYDMITESIVLSIDQVGQVWQVATDGTRTTISAPGIHNHSGYTIRVENRALVNLPETGGTGTQRYTICGSALMLAAVYMIIVKRRKEDRNTS